MAIIRCPQKTAVGGVWVFWGTSPEQALGGGNATTRLDCHGLAQGETQRLERRLRDVMTIAAANDVDVDRRPEMNRERLPELLGTSAARVPMGTPKATSY